MLKVLSVEQIRELDSYTIKDQGIESIDLMERACRAFMEWFTVSLDNRYEVGVICGAGNNGGDGLGIARMLHERAYTVRVWTLPGRPSTDFEINLERARRANVPITNITTEATVTGEIFDTCDVLIDAIFGSGLSRPVEGIYAHVIGVMNNARARRIAVDLPSGLLADRFSSGAIVKADATVSFQLPKLPFFFPQCYVHTGEWQLVDIGLSKDFIKKADSPYYFMTPKGPRKLLKKRSKFDHKGTYGHALLIAGSYGKMGAAILSSNAAIRSGLGLLTTHVPRNGVDVLQTAVPEAMASIDRSEEVFTSPPDLTTYSTVGIGPGLGKSIETTQAFKLVLQQFRKPMVIDADALNMLGENPDLIDLIPEGSILTPHPKEFERLAGKWTDDFRRLEMQRALAARIRCIIVVKGAYSAIAAPDGSVYFNGTGNPGMATGGTGDVLTGILTGLLAQQYEPLDAARLGVFLHGLSGDLAVPEIGMNSLKAGDIVEFLPEAFLKLRRD